MRPRVVRTVRGGVELRREPTDWTQRYSRIASPIKESCAVLGIRRGRRYRPRNQAHGCGDHLCGRKPPSLPEAQASIGGCASLLAKTVACDDLSKAKLALRSLDGACSTLAKCRMRTQCCLARCDRSLQGGPATSSISNVRWWALLFYLLQIGRIARAITYLEEATALSRRPGPRPDGQRPKPICALARGPRLCRAN